MKEAFQSCFILHDCQLTLVIRKHMGRYLYKEMNMKCQSIPSHIRLYFTKIYLYLCIQRKNLRVKSLYINQNLLFLLLIFFFNSVTSISFDPRSEFANSCIYSWTIAVSTSNTPTDDSR